MIHGGKFIESAGSKIFRRLQACSRATSCRLVMQNNREAWKPPPESAFKLNFNVVVFSKVNRSGVGAIIRNYKGEVMATMSTRGPTVHSSEKGELLACRKAIEFGINAGLSKLVIEGDNVNVIKAVKLLFTTTLCWL